MEFETLNALQDSIYLSLLMMTKIIALVFTFFAIGAFIFYLTGVVWCCFEETQQSRTARQTIRRAWPPHPWKSASRALDTQARPNLAGINVVPLRRVKQPPPVSLLVRRVQTGSLTDQEAVRSGAHRRSSFVTPQNPGY